ncbi:hypothetical protein BCR44DRAFT_1432184 [Catenaria anguillulae PL171]|uniref:Uncharacterized protein n=1 Tax=Catenaria anguillulae PL171 TaxID=765915 RepID=A0A1Y2HTV8_9FUNG|nr:hypothetical protein BCR44DRAFT_1432184 [Catenaria anguillulae PL171]
MFARPFCLRSCEYSGASSLAASAHSSADTKLSNPRSRARYLAVQTSLWARINASHDPTGRVPPRLCVQTFVRRQPNCCIDHLPRRALTVRLMLLQQGAYVLERGRNHRNSRLLGRPHPEPKNPRTRSNIASATRELNHGRDGRLAPSACPPGWTACSHA